MVLRVDEEDYPRYFGKVVAPETTGLGGVSGVGERGRERERRWCVNGYKRNSW